MGGHALAAPLERDFSAVHHQSRGREVEPTFAPAPLAPSLLGAHLLGASLGTEALGRSMHQGLANQGLSRASRARLGGTMSHTMPGLMSHTHPCISGMPCAHITIEHQGTARAAATLLVYFSLTPQRLCDCAVYRSTLA